MLRAAVLSFYAGAALSQDTGLELPWEQFKRDHGRAYDTSAEHEHRMDIFQRNLEFVNAENLKGHSYTLGITGFMDLTPEEFQARRSPLNLFNLSLGPKLGEHSALQDVDVASSIDWQEAGAMNAVLDENQNGCYGMCWAFTATAAIEAAHKISSGNLVKLSEQQLGDCSSSYRNQGCNGGLPDYAFNYAQAHGLCTEDSYSYNGPTGSCRESSCDVALAQGTVQGHRSVQASSEQALMSALAQQPVATAVQGAWNKGNTFQFYKSGILGSECGQDVDHAVLVVGYGTSSEGDYWKIKNSYGTSWGLDGYALLKRGELGSKGTGTCGLLQIPSYPVLGAVV